MTKFSFAAEQEDGTISVLAFTSENWPDTFPKYLDFLRSVGFTVQADTMLYTKGLSKRAFEDRNYIRFQEDDEVADVQESEHSYFFFDYDRNK